MQPLASIDKAEPLCPAANGHASILQEILSIVSPDPRPGQQTSEAQRLLHKKVLNQKASKGQTPLVLACETGSAPYLPCEGVVSFVAVILQDVQFSHLVCRHAYCARYLIEQGADPFIQDRSHRMALHHAAANGRSAVLKVLLSDSLKIQTANGAVCLKDARRQSLESNCRCVDSDTNNLFFFTKSTSACTVIHTAKLHPPIHEQCCSH